MFCYTVPSATAPLHYLKSRPNVLFPEEGKELQRRLEDKYLNSHHGQLVEVFSGASTSRSKRAEAKRYLRDFKVFSWIQQQNRHQGVATSGRQVVTQRDAAAVSLSPCLQLELRPYASVVVEKWLQRFRRRWRVDWGRLPVRTVLPAPVLKAKAPHNCFPF